MPMTNVYNGNTGTLTLANEATPEGNDAKAIVDTYQVQTVGRVSGVEISVNTELQEYYEVGRRHATSLHPGNIHIEGSVERAYINGALLFLLLGRGANPTALKEPYVQPTFNMTVVLNDPAVPANSAGLELKGVKFMNWSYSLPEDDFVMENVKFRALTVSVVDKEGAKEKAPAFPK